MVRRFRLQGLALSVLLFGCAFAEDDKGPEPAGDGPFELVGPFYAGSGSVPWHATFSPCGRWTAVVEGYVRRSITVFDARTRKRVWSTSPGGQPASYRPIFIRSGERLVLVEGNALVVRARKGESWEPVARAPLGYDPGVTAFSRPITLAPDEQSAVLVNDSRAYRARLGATNHPAVAIAGVEHVVAAHYLGPRLALSRWAEGIAETVILGVSGKVDTRLKFAVLAASDESRTWLVARTPPSSAKRLVLHLVDADTHAVLGQVLVKNGWQGRASLTQAVFSPDGRRVTMIESMRTGTVLDARTGRVQQRIRLYERDRMIGLAFSADGRSLVTAGRRPGSGVQDEAVLLWRLRGEKASSSSPER